VGIQAVCLILVRPTRAPLHVCLHPVKAFEELCNAVPRRLTTRRVAGPAHAAFPRRNSKRPPVRRCRWYCSIESSADQLHGTRYRLTDNRDVRCCSEHFRNYPPSALLTLRVNIADTHIVRLPIASTLTHQSLHLAV
jgi:hypothetical protein